MAKLESQNWSILIPDNWSDNKSDNNEQLYFESEDSSMGFYISTYINSDDTPYELKHIESNLNIEKKNTDKMKGYNFQILNKKLLQNQQYSIGILDSYDQMKRYRIYIKYIAIENRLVRISFHDYDWSENSAKMVDFIMDSLEIK
ncbi:MAG: hypothetical protein Q8928_08870 [Bacteroidota bacterium]|nr:hypothetical protein [Bacteroidota bacterium]